MQVKNNRQAVTKELYMCHIIGNYMPFMRISVKHILYIFDITLTTCVL